MMLPNPPLGSCYLLMLLVAAPTCMPHTLTTLLESTTKFVSVSPLPPSNHLARKSRLDRNGEQHRVESGDPQLTSE